MYLKQYFLLLAITRQEFVYQNFNNPLLSDSLLYLLQTNNLYEELHKIKDELDLSTYPETHFLHDKSRRMIPGFFKDETAGIPIKDFCGLRAKCYSMTLESNEDKLKTYGMKKKKNFKDQKLATAGVKSSVHDELRHQRFLDILNANSTYDITQHTIKSINHTLYTMKTTRIGLSALDIKRYTHEDGIQTLPYGHYQIK